MNVIVEHSDLFLSGLVTTLKICLIATVGSLAVGSMLATMRVCPVAPLRLFGATWVHLFRNSPFPVVLFFFAFGLPLVGLEGTYFVFGVAGLICYTAAFVCEALRSGINTVGRGQGEAARALGLGFATSMRLVIMPQAARSCVQPLTNVLVSMVKDTAIVGAFGVGGDLFAVADNLVSTNGYPAVPVLIGIIAGYLVIILPLGQVSLLAERRLAVKR
jgi:glutamate transport system permease protein